MSLKSKIYKALKVWNDADSVRKGTVHKRVGRRAFGKVTGKLMGKIFK